MGSVCSIKSMDRGSPSQREVEELTFLNYDMKSC